MENNEWGRESKAGNQCIAEYPNHRVKALEAGDPDHNN